MRIVLTLCLVLWFAVWTLVGYRMTEKDFSWLDKSPAAQGASAPKQQPSSIPTTKAEAVKVLNNLTPQQRDCLLGVATPEQLAVIQQGKMPSVGASQMAAIALCLK